MRDILLVFIGGGIGSSLRLLVNWIIPSSQFPYSTLVVNLIGSFLIGFIISYMMHENILKSDYYYFSIIGICGGLTTFSAFSIENLNMLKSNDITTSVFLYDLQVQIIDLDQI